MPAQGSFQLTSRLTFRLTFRLTVLLLVALASACTGLRSSTEPPEVTLTSVALLGVTLLEQEWELTLRARNPNDFPLTLRSLDYRIFIEDSPFGRGMTGTAVTVPAMGDALVTTRVVTSLFDTLRQFQALDFNPGQPVRYRIDGHARLGGSPLKLKFDHEGAVTLPAF